LVQAIYLIQGIFVGRWQSFKLLARGLTKVPKTIDVKNVDPQNKKKNVKKRVF